MLCVKRPPDWSAATAPALHTHLGKRQRVGSHRQVDRAAAAAIGALLPVDDEPSLATRDAPTPHPHPHPHARHDVSEELYTATQVKSIVEAKEREMRDVVDAKERELREEFTRLLLAQQHSFLKYCEDCLRIDMRARDNAYAFSYCG